MKKASRNQRQKIIALLAELWEANPDLRLGQLMVNVVRGDPFYIEDRAMLARLEHVKRYGHL